jgi:hypothetical protein
MFGLQTGSYITIQEIEKGGDWKVIEHGRSVEADDSKLPRFIVGQKKSGDISPSKSPPLGGPKDAVRFILEPGPDGSTVLKVSNGYERRLLYKGALQRRPDGQFERTSLCIVPGRLLSFELWPFPLHLLSLGHLELVEENGEPIVCE